MSSSLILRTSEKLITEPFVGNTTNGFVILSNCHFTSVRTKFAHFDTLPQETSSFFCRFNSSVRIIPIGYISYDSTQQITLCIMYYTESYLLFDILIRCRYLGSCIAFKYLPGCLHIPQEVIFYYIPTLVRCQVCFKETVKEID